MEPKKLTADEIVKLKNGELEAAWGGTGKPNADNLTFTCPKCGSTDVYYHDCGGYIWCRCNKCGYEGYIPY